MRRSSFATCLLAACVAIGGARADDVDDAIRRRDLNAEDHRLNNMYLMLSWTDDGYVQRELRSAQRAWLRWRNQECGSRELGDRDAWLDAITADLDVWNCVYTATVARGWQLQRELAAARDPVYPSRANPRSRHEKWTLPERTVGRWYFEVAVNRGKIARTKPTELRLGFVHDDALTGVIQPVNADETAAGVSIYGLAIDLDEGRVYHHLDGVWEGAAATRLDCSS